MGSRRPPRTRVEFTSRSQGGQGTGDPARDMIWLSAASDGVAHQAPPPLGSDENLTTPIYLSEVERSGVRRGGSPRGVSDSRERRQRSRQWTQALFPPSSGPLPLTPSTASNIRRREAPVSCPASAGVLADPSRFREERAPCIL